MTPKSRRLFGQDHATTQVIRAKWRSDLIPFRSRSAHRTSEARPLSARLDVVGGLHHQLVHGAANLVIGLRDALGVEVRAQLAECGIAARRLQLRGNDAHGIGLRRGTGEPELFGSPQPDELVAPRLRPEPYLLVMREFLLEAFLAFVEARHVTSHRSRGHLCFRSPCITRRWRQAALIQVKTSTLRECGGGTMRIVPRTRLG